MTTVRFLHMEVYIMSIDVINSKVPKYSADTIKQPVKTEVQLEAPNLQAAVTTQKVSSAQSNQKESNNQSEQQQNQAKEGQLSEEFIKTTVKDTNSRLKAANNTKCEFKYHEETKRISITIRDKNTDEVIKEIPPEKSLELVAKMWELAGILVDERR